MKRILLALMLLTTPTMVATTITKADIIKTVEHQRQLVHEAQVDAEIAKKELVVVQEAINTQTAKLHETEAELNIARKELSDVRKHFNMLLFLCSSLIGILVFSIIQRFSSILLAFYPPALASNWLISIGSGAIAGTIAWQFLARL